MPSFDSNDPREFGWSLGFRDFVPFSYAGHSFPQGMHPLFVPVLTEALRRLVAAGLDLPPLSMGLNAGMWGQEDRQVTGGGSISFHQYGLAADVCAPWNPFGVATPKESQYRLPTNTSALVEPLGLLWGGGPRWGQRRDWMHLQCNSSPDEMRRVAAGLKGDGNPPGRPVVVVFPLPAGCYYGPAAGPKESISGTYASDARWRPGLRLAQRVLGVVQDGLYGPKTAAAARSWQSRHHLEADGLIGPATWRSLFPHG